MNAINACMFGKETLLSNVRSDVATYIPMWYGFGGVDLECRSDKKEHYASHWGKVWVENGIM